MPDSEASARRRARYLDNRWLVAVVLGAALSVVLAGMLGSTYHYADARFIIDYVETELQLTVLLLAATLAFFPGNRLGLRRPQRWHLRGWWPLALMVAVAFGVWLKVRTSLPADAVVDNGRSLLLLRTTVLVGLNEEWLFRGLALAAMSHWWGLRAGALASLLLFGAFHLLNMAAGMPPAAAAEQVIFTILAGAVFLKAALDTGSLALPIVGHALYDFLVVDMSTLWPGASGAEHLKLLVPGVGAVLGLYCLLGMRRLKGYDAYPERRR